MILATLTPHDATSRQRAQRSNTFLMATVVSDTVSAPVRIKNISSSGALFTGNQLPLVGESCRLRRGELSIAGKIVRVSGRSAAIHFARDIDVTNWLGAPQHLQTEVDRVVQAEKHRYPVADTSHRIVAIRRQDVALLAPSPVSADELRDLADQIDRLANLMSDDPHVISTYQERLQVLDIASQRLRGLANT